MPETLRFLFTGLLLAASVFICFTEVVGVARLKYALNRMHAAAMGDTLGLLFACAGLAVSAGEVFSVIKLGILVIFMWMASPVSSHLIALSEATDNPDVHKEAEEIKK
ncbi:MAG: monovalent cation/H(+) antiporter subunit G [Clostridia bacterium]|nr:monovalent cation/H(+) antiporter subunit G [Clostridia bacterium]